jgi:hypothetical protein
MRSAFHKYKNDCRAHKQPSDCYANERIACAKRPDLRARMAWRVARGSGVALVGRDRVAQRTSRPRVPVACTPRSRWLYPNRQPCRCLPLAAHQNSCRELSAVVERSSMLSNGPSAPHLPMTCCSLETAGRSRRRRHAASLLLNWSTARFSACRGGRDGVRATASRPRLDRHADRTSDVLPMREGLCSRSRCVLLIERHARHCLRFEWFSVVGGGFVEDSLVEHGFVDLVAERRVVAELRIL